MIIDSWQQIRERVANIPSNAGYNLLLLTQRQSAGNRQKTVEFATCLVQESGGGFGREPKTQQEKLAIPVSKSDWLQA
jgi:hypothetical protein